MISLGSPLATSAGPMPGALSDQDEAWVISEVESELGEARARMDARAGRPWSPPAARPPFPVREGGAA
jgi:hypothetical protein